MHRYHTASRLVLLALIMTITQSCKMAAAIKYNMRDNHIDVLTPVTMHKLPFRLTGGKIIVAVKIGPDSAEAHLVVDYGAHTLLSSRFAQAHHIPFADSVVHEVNTPAGGTVEIKKYTASNILLNIEGVSIRKEQLTITRFDMLSAT